MVEGRPVCRDAGNDIDTPNPGPLVSRHYDVLISANSFLVIVVVVVVFGTCKAYTAKVLCNRVAEET